MGYYLHDGTYIDDPSMTQAQADAMYAYSQAHNNDAPAGVTADDLRYLVPQDAPIATDQTGQYRTSYAGNKVYLPNGQRPDTTFFKGPAQWNPLTGQWDQGTNWGGFGGALLGAGAVGAPALIGPAVAGAFGGGAAAGGAAADAGVLPSTSLAGVPGMTGLAPSLGLVSDTAVAPAAIAGAGAAGAGSGSMSFLSSILPDLFKGGFDLTGALIGTHGNTEAAKIAAQSAKDALDFEKSQYAAKQAALSPYGSVGRGAIGALGSAYGLSADTPPPSPNAPAFNSLASGGARMAANLASTNGLMRGGGVLMRAPNGTTQMVSPDLVSHYQSLGATVVGGA